MMARARSNVRNLLRRAAAAIVTGIALGLGTAGAAEQSLHGHRFTLPEGFVVERAVAPELAPRPITADFDERGRLYVADSSGTNDKVQQQLADRPHRILRLEDTDGDGHFDRSTVFADRMMFPEGTLWHDGSLYVAAPPSIWKLTDADDDGVAEQREEWHQGRTLTGCANDLHGPYLGPDGWIYWCKGAFAEQSYPRPGLPPLVSRAAHILRARPDGSGLEPVMTGGMDNPVDVVFLPGGERLFSTTFLQHPAGGRRDGLLHAVYGGVYGKVHGVLDGHRRTGPDVLPVLSHLGPAAPCGLHCYGSTVFGPEYRGRVFACLFNLRKVTQHALTPAGGTFISRDEDFLVSDQRDFHPTDVLEDADGSLLVVDTGGWYKLCCPTSQLVKADALGSIYRIRRQGAERLADPRGLRLAWDGTAPRDLAERLSDRRPAVARRASARLSKLGAPAVEALRMALPAATAETRETIVWTASRIEGETARELVRSALADPAEVVRQAAIHAVSVRRDRGAAAALVRLLGGDSPQNQRAAAEALGRLGDPRAAAALLAASRDTADPMLRHSLTYALIELEADEPIAAALADGSTDLGVALAALDQMESPRLAAPQVLPLLSSADDRLRQLALWIVGRRPAWGPELRQAGAVRLARLAKLAPAERESLRVELSQSARMPEMQAFLGERLVAPGTTSDERRLLLAALAASDVRTPPPSWQRGVAAALAAEDLSLMAAAVAACRAWTLPKDQAAALGQALVAVAGRETAPEATRLAALAAAPTGSVELSAERFAWWLAAYRAANEVGLRALAIEGLLRARLSGSQLQALTGELMAAGPLELDRLLAAFEQSQDLALGMAVVDAVGRAPAAGSLRPDAVRNRLAKYPEPVRRAADALTARLHAGLEAQRARLDGLLSGVPAGDVIRGQAVFNGSKAGCAACHAIGYVGGKLGPDLTRIGQIRQERDLLESIVLPSASFVRSFEPLTIVTTDGRTLHGLPVRETAEELVLSAKPGEELRVPRGDIEELRPGTVSVMPAGIDRLLTPQELADLVAFLKACR